MFSRREKILLAVAAVAVAVVIVGLQLSGSAAGNATANGGRDTRQWNSLRRSVKDTEARLRQTTIAGSEAPAHLLRAAQAEGAATGVTIALARPRTPTRTSAGCIERALEIQATGGFPSVARFMFNLEANNPKLRISRVAISSSDGTSDKVNSTIIITAYSPGEVKQWQKVRTTSRGRALP